MILLLQSGLPQNAIEGAGSKIILGMPRNGNPPRFGRMLKLPMTPLLGHHRPSIFLDYTLNFPYSRESSSLGSSKEIVTAVALHEAGKHFKHLDFTLSDPMKQREGTPRMKGSEDGTVVKG